MKPMVFLVLISCAPQDDAEKKRAAVKDALGQLPQGKGDLVKLTVTYDDLHGLHGGLQLTIRGDGKVEQKAVRLKTGEPKEAVERKDIDDLVKLLVRHEVWEQRVPERAAVPDESRARLSVSVGEHTVRIWEWFNDLAKNRRMVEVRDFMTKIAQKPEPRK